MDVQCNKAGSAGWLKRCYRSKTLGVRPGQIATPEQYLRNQVRIVTVKMTNEIVLRLDQNE